LAEQYEYDAFGQPYFFNASGTEFTSSQLKNRFLFTGREYLSELKLYDYRNRLYQPELGRFLQPDPKEFAAGDYNLYRYCHNDPINKTDPSGLASFTGTGIAEYQKLKEVIGSHIPQWVTMDKVAVTFTLSGNFSNANPAAHIVAAGSLGYLNGNPLKGRTDASTHARWAGNTLNANLHIDYYIVARKYNALEREHTFGVEGGGDRTKGFLEKGGCWDRIQQQFGGGISNFLGSGRFMLGAGIDSELGKDKAAQHATWDQPGGRHDVDW